MKNITAVKFLLLFVLIIIVIFVSCSEESKNSIAPPDEAEGLFEYGEEKIYTVDNTPNFVVSDTDNNITLLFPEGGIGNVTTSSITSSPFVPTEGGSGIKIDYSGDTPIYLVIDTSDGHSAKVFEYGKFMGCYDYDIGNGEIWKEVPKSGINGSEITFILMMPYELSKTAASNTEYGSNNYWTVRIEQDISELIHEVEIKDSISNFYKRFENTLPISIKSKVKTKRDSKKLSIVFLDPGIIFKNGPYYSGLWFKSFIGGLLYTPTIHLLKNTNIGTAAHETGHYLIHLLVGDVIQNTLELQDPGSNHGIGDIIGRNFLLEDLAYFAEFFLKGSGGNHDLHRPYDLFRHRSPLTDDFPSYEGFASHLLAQLTRTESKIRDFANDQFQNIPLVNLSYGEVFEIISKGATDVNKLRENIENYLGSKAPALPIIAHRVGWRYTLKGKLVDSSGDPVSDATVEPLSIYNGIEYKGSFTGGNTSTNYGSFYILEEGFPGKSILRIKLVNGDSTDIPIEIDWDKLTTETIDLGDIKVLTKKITIINITPSSGKVGEVVQINGNNFGTSQSTGEVWFGSVKVSDIISWSDTQLEVNVPQGLAAGDVDVHIVVGSKESNYVSFSVEEESDPNDGYWVLYETKEINGCQFYESECWPLEDCSGSAGNYSITIGSSTCSNTSGYSGSGSYTVPPSQFIPGDTYVFDVTASGSGYTRVDICYYANIENMSFDEYGYNTGDSPSRCDKIVSCFENSSPATGEYKISEYPDEDGALLVEGSGSIGTRATSRRYFFLYKWQE